MFVPKQIKTIHALLADAGRGCYIVGGAVRNHVAGLKPTDYDLATDARPEEVMRIFRRTVPTGVDHGTVTILMGREQYEITTFRTESDYSDGRHPDRIEFSDSIEADLSRRDFTMNALAWDIGASKIIDLYDGVRAIQEGRIEAIGDARERFREDALRIMRACRFAAQLGFQVEETTLDAATAEIDGLERISAERIRDELLKLICGAECVRGIELMRRTGALAVVLPELEAAVGVEQKGAHAFDVYEHSLYSCEGAPADDPVLRLAALLHDIGKPASRRIAPNGDVTFHRHEQLGAEIGRAILGRLKLPKQTIRRVGHLIEHHMFNYTDEWSDAAVRRLVSRVGTEEIGDLFRLRAADAYGMTRAPGSPKALTALSRRIEDLLERESALTLKDLAVDGRDLMEAGIPAGKMLGVVLNQLLEAVLDDPAMNERERLIRLALNLYNQLKSGGK